MGAVEVDDGVDVRRSVIYAQFSVGALLVLLVLRVVGEVDRRPGWWALVVIGAVGVLAVTGVVVNLYRFVSSTEERALASAARPARRRVGRAVRRGEPVADDDDAALARLVARARLRSADNGMCIGLLVAAGQAFPYGRAGGLEDLPGVVLFAAAAGLVAFSNWSAVRMRRFLVPHDPPG